MAPKGLAPDDATFQTPICDAMNFDGLAKQDHSCKDCGKVGLALATTNHALCEPSDTPQVKLQKGVVGLVQAELHFCQFLRRPCHELQEKLVYELMLRQLELDNTILASDHKAVQGALECLKGRRKQHLGAPNTKSSKAGGIRDPVNATLIKCLDTILSVTHPISLMKSYHRCQTFFSVHEHGWKVQLANRLLEADKLFRDNKAILRGIIPKKMVDEVNARVGDYFAYSDLENPASHRGRLAGRIIRACRLADQKTNATVRAIDEILHRGTKDRHARNTRTRRRVNIRRTSSLDEREDGRSSKRRKPHSTSNATNQPQPTSPRKPASMKAREQVPKKHEHVGRVSSSDEREVARPVKRRKPDAKPNASKQPDKARELDFSKPPDRSNPLSAVRGAAVSDAADVQTSKGTPKLKARRLDKNPSEDSRKATSMTIKSVRPADRVVGVAPSSLARVSQLGRSSSKKGTMAPNITKEDPSHSLNKFAGIASPSQPRDSGLGSADRKDSKMGVGDNKHGGHRLLGRVAGAAQSSTVRTSQTDKNQKEKITAFTVSPKESQGRLGEEKATAAVSTRTGGSFIDRDGKKKYIMIRTGGSRRRICPIEGDGFVPSSIRARSPAPIRPAKKAAMMTSSTLNNGNSVPDSKATASRKWQSGSLRTRGENSAPADSDDGSLLNPDGEPNPKSMKTCSKGKGKGKKPDSGSGRANSSTDDWLQKMTLRYNELDTAGSKDSLPEADASDSSGLFVSDRDLPTEKV